MLISRQIKACLNNTCTFNKTKLKLGHTLTLSISILSLKDISIFIYLLRLEIFKQWSIKFVHTYLSLNVEKALS